MLNNTVSPASRSTEYPADYIPCVFTLAELLGLRLKPVSATLTSSDEENLKERLVSEATVQANSSALSTDKKSEFLRIVANQSFEGLTPSAALANVIAILQQVDSEEAQIKQLEDAAQTDVAQLINLAELQLNKEDVTEDEMKAIDAKLRDNMADKTNPIDRLIQLANNGSVAQTVHKYNYPNLDLSLQTLSRNLQTAAKNLQILKSPSAPKQGNEEAKELAREAIAKQAIVDTARTTIAAFQRPLDVGCAMSVLSWNEVRYAFGRLIANEYIGVQVVVRNLNEKQDFALHDAELSVDTDINGRYGRFYSGRDKLIVRGLSLAQADFTPRNLVVHIAEAAGNLMSAVIPVAGNVFKDAAGVYNGGFMPGLKTTWADHSVSQLNLLSDLGFSSSTNYKTVVPKSGTVMFVMFIPSKQFDQGWWTQKCVEHITLVDQRPRLAPKSNSPSQERGPDSVGIDLAAERDQCLKYFTESDHGEASKPPTGEMPKTQDAIAPPHISTYTILPVKQVPYRKWSPIALAIFRELAWTVVAGAHIQETQNQSSITQLNCPTDDLGNLQFNEASGGTLSCDISGQGLDKVATLRLRNAQDATDTETADGPVTVSGDPTKAKVAFQLSKLGSLNNPTYKVYLVTTTGVESFANQTVHLDLKPLAQDVSPKTADPNNQNSITFTLTGFHLDKIAMVQLNDSSEASPQYNLDSGGTATHASFTVKATDDMKKQASKSSGEKLTISLLVKNSLGSPVTTDLSITFQSKASPASSSQPAPSQDQSKPTPTGQPKKKTNRQ